MTMSGIPPSAQIVDEVIDHLGYRWQLRLVRCGKPNCTRCPHGPYWYKQVFRDAQGRPRWLYKGKSAPKTGGDEP